MDLKFIADQLQMEGLTSQPLDISPSFPITVEVSSSQESTAHGEAAKCPTVKTSKVSLGAYLLRKKQSSPKIESIRPEDDPISASESDSDTVSSSDEDDGDTSMFDKAFIMESDCEEELEDGQLTSGYLPKTANELPDLPPVSPLPFIKVPDELDLVHAGEISSIVGAMVIVESFPLANNNQALDNGSILIFEDRSVLGEVFEIFGPIHQPFYVVRFNNVSDIDTDRIFKGAFIYQNSQFSKPVFTEMLRKLKGSDASNIFDEEIPEEEQEFSDDEREQEVKAKKSKNSKSKKRSRAQDFPPTPPSRPIHVYEDNISSQPSGQPFLAPHYRPSQQPAQGVQVAQNSPTLQPTHGVHVPQNPSNPHQQQFNHYNVPYYNYQPYPYQPNAMLYHGNQYMPYPPPNFPYPWPQGYNPQ